MAGLVVGMGFDFLKSGVLFLIVEIIKFGSICADFHSSKVIISTLDANSGLRIAPLSGDREIT